MSQVEGEATKIYRDSYENRIVWSCGGWKGPLWVGQGLLLPEPDGSL